MCVIINARQPACVNEYYSEANTTNDTIPHEPAEPPVSEEERERRIANGMTVYGIRSEMRRLQDEMPLPNPTVSNAARPKRKYSKYTQQQIDVVKKIHQMDLTRKQAISHGVELLGMSRSYLSSLFRKLDKGVSIDKSTVRRGRRRVYRVEHYSKIAELIINDPTITDENICHELEVTFHRKFSRSAIQQIRNSQEAMAMVGLRPLTFKVASNRGPNAQSPENKERRINVVKEMLNLGHRYQQIFIDETHWQFVRRFNYGKSEKEKKAIVNRQGRTYNMSSIMAISTEGPHHTAVFVGKSITTDDFIAYFNHLVEGFANEYCVFYLDNAAIHHTDALNNIINPAKHKILFGAPYSPEMNPIEMVFKDWKEKVEATTDMPPNEREMLDILVNTWNNLTSQLCRECIAHVLDEVYPKVLNREDI